MQNGKFNINSEASQGILVKAFNRRDKSAYAFIFTLYYDHLYHFSAKLYQNTDLDAADLIQDIFLGVWENKKNDFCSLAHIKNYLFLSVRNHFRKYLEHKKSVDKYTQSLLQDSDYLISEMVEIEVISKLSLLVDTLPEECGKVLKLYMEGEEMKEIAQRLDKSLSTIYNQKTEAISILKRKLSKDFFSLILSILN